jgi:DNA-binding NarL/FixJ family response regulator
MSSLPISSASAGTREPRVEAGDVRLLVVDDHPAVRAGVMALLAAQPGLSVLDAVDSAEAALSIARVQPVDVAVVDYQLGSRSGLWLSRKLKTLRPAPRVIVYSAYCDGPLAAACVVAEADALVSKGGPADELCQAVRAVAAGTSALPPVPYRLAQAMRRRLEVQDQAVFGMLLAGSDTAEVATTLGMAPADLDLRMWAMLHKLEWLGSDPVGPRPYGAASLRQDWR